MAVHLQDVIDERALRGALTGAQRQAHRDGRPILASVVRPLPAVSPLTAFTRAAALAADRAYWERPDEDLALAAAGAAQVLVADGPQPIPALAAAWREASAGAAIDAPVSVKATGPLVLGGFAFDPVRPHTPLWQGFPAGRLVLPRYLITRRGGDTWLTINCRMTPEDDPATTASAIGADLDRLLLRADEADPLAGAALPVASATEPDWTLEDLTTADDWQAMVAALLLYLRQGQPQKVVLARAARLRRPGPWDLAPVLGQLRQSYPTCVIFAMASGTRCFLGATPERLVRRRENLIETMALAGTTARGATPEEDHRLGEALLASAKNRGEHAIVVRAIQEALALVCPDLQVPAAPALLPVRNVQHLCTPIVAQVSPQQGLLELVERLHPTPGVAGYPREAARAMIRAREGLDRGWYAGPVGWLDAHNEGEFVVAIRSALLTEAGATLFAGCGIVADSEPASEYAESCLKLRPMLAALGSRIP